MTCLLIPAVIAPIFNAFAEFVIFIGIPLKGAKAEIETHPIIVGTETSKCST